MEVAPLNRFLKLLLFVAAFLAANQPLSSQPQEKSVKREQLRFSHVRTASQEKDAALREVFSRKSVAYPPKAILLRAFKKEGKLELWANGTGTGSYTLIKTYKICTSSGVLGPKRRFGDEQVPEGFYLLDWFNPQSNFFLSMHISYPNAADRILGSRQNPGGDIFLHGNCASIGCIPISDDGIKEVYWLAVLVEDGGQKQLPIQIFPARLDDGGFRKLAAEHRGEPELIAFWSNLKEGFDLFEKTRQPVPVHVRKDGAYEFPVAGAASESR